MQETAKEVGAMWRTLFDETDLLGRMTSHGARPWVPAADVLETDDEVIVHLDVPGMDGEDLTIELEDGVLSISGERASAGEEARAARLERPIGGFQRILRAPRGVNPNDIDATLDAGVLTVRLPKPETLRPHTVEIESGERRRLEAAA